MLKCWQTTREDEEIEQLPTGEESKLTKLRMLLFQMPCPCIFRVERLAASFNKALKFLVTHGMFGRNVIAKILGETSGTNRTFVRIVNNEFGSISTPCLTQIVPSRAVLRSVCPYSIIELG